MATTLQNLRDGVRIETRDPDGILFQDEDIDYNINQAYRTTYQQIANVLKNYFIPDPIVQAITANTREYALPADFLRMVKAEIIIGNTWIPMLRYQRGYTSNYVGGTNLGISYSIPTFDYEGDNLVLEPTPRATIANGMRWTYVQVPETLINPGDTIHANFKDLWRDLVQLRAAKSCFSQMEAVGSIVSTEALESRLEDLEAQLLQSLSLRAMAPAKKRRKNFFQ